MRNETLFLLNSVEGPQNYLGRHECGRVEEVSSISFRFYAGIHELKNMASHNTAKYYSEGQDFVVPACMRWYGLPRAETHEFYQANEIMDLARIRNINKINKMAHFSDNWNGTGGSAFSRDAICIFKHIIERLEKQPDIAPTGRNSMLMQYELEDRSLLVFEVTENRAEKVFIPQGDYSMAQMGTYTSDIEQQINESVRNFYGSEEN